jgi:hypothetical protein
MKTFLLFLCFAAALPAQTIEGTVYDAISGAPLPGASVSTGNGANAPVVRSDASGHFQLQLQTSYGPSVMATKAGYVQSGTQAGKNAQAVRIELKPEAIITGKIVDEDGFPAGNGQVQAMRYQVFNGQRTLGFGATGQIDELGQYRIDSLPAGKYYLYVNSNDARNWDSRYVPQFLGGTLQPDDNHMVELKAGEWRKDTDIQLVRFEGVTVSGKVDGVTLNPRVSGPLVSLTADQPAGGPFFQAFSRGADTTFTMRHVPPGTYKLHYGQGQPRAGDLYSEVSVVVGEQDVRDVVVTPHVLQPVDLKGQVVSREGGTPGPWMVYLRSPMGSGVTAHTNEDGSFAVPGLLPQHYSVQTTPDRFENQGKVPPGHVVSIMLDEQDVKDKGFDLDGPPQKPLVVTVSKLYANISGTIVDSQGAPLANAAIVFRSGQPGGTGGAATNDKGQFQAWLPEAGDYHLYVAADQSEIVTLSDSDFLTAHQADFPILRVAIGDNPPVTLVRNPRPAH